MNEPDHAPETTPRIVIAAPSSGSGKTTLTLGIMAALQKRGMKVQGFKCGPDYIDPGYHTAVTGRTSRNLDSWFAGREGVRKSFVRGATGADIAVIEGVMGLFDGRSPLSDDGSTADIASILGAPVILVIDARSQARSAAALVKGFQLFSDKIKIAGVIANRSAGKNHTSILKEAIEKECGIPLLGALERDKTAKIEIPERHLGLLPAVERGELDGLFTLLGEIVEESLDLDALVGLAQSAPPLQIEQTPAAKTQTSAEPVVIAVAKDSAFHFYYPENLELLEELGAKIEYFSPLADEPPPENAGGLYLGGGFPEEFAARLAANETAKKAVASAVKNGMPAIAECGGLMYLTDAIICRNERKSDDSKSDDKMPVHTGEKSRHLMTGVIPGEVIMQERLAALGYREARGLPGNPWLGEDETIKAHEFHYSRFESSDGKEPLPPAYDSAGRTGSGPAGALYRNLVASYLHLYFPSQAGFAERFVSACREFAAHKSGN